MVKGQDMQWITVKSCMGHILLRHAWWIQTVLPLHAFFCGSQISAELAAKHS